MVDKQAMSINNAQFAVLTASEDFIKTALILVSGIVTDRIGGASAKHLANVMVVTYPVLTISHLFLARCHALW